MRRALTFLLAALVVVGMSYAAVALFSGDSDPPRPQVASGVAPLGVPQGAPATGPASSELNRLIGVFEQRIAERDDLTDLAFLGRLYLRKATVTGDLRVYDQAVFALERVLATWTDNWEAAAGLAAARLAVHDFEGALEIANLVLSNQPGRLDAVAAVGDAHLALGDNEAAAAVFADLEAAVPGNPAVDVRLSRLAFLTGDTDRATALAAAAVASAERAGFTGSDLAWFHAYQGSLHFSLGRLDRAEAAFAAARAAAPTYAPALAGLARAATAAGNYQEAIDLYLQATAAVPHPDYLSELGDVYTLTGDANSAQAQYDTVVAIGRLAEANGSAYNRLLLMFYADHDVQPTEALRLAEGEIALRRDVYGYDALAWALYRNGRYEEARAASEQALVLGTPEASFWYHAGLISEALGERTRAAEEVGRALEINPAFHPLLGADAAAALARLSVNS